MSKRANASQTQIRPGRKSVELQVALAIFARQVFPEVNWLDKVRAEKLMESEVFQELVAYRKIKIEVLCAVFARQLRARLGKNRRTERLVARLPLCTEAILEKVGDLLVGPKKKPELFAALERLAPKAP